MKQMRLVEVEDANFKIGDVIQFNLKDGEYAEAIAVSQEPDGMVFCFVDCLAEECSLTNGGVYEYEKSLMRRHLNEDVLKQLPSALKKIMVPFENGDLLRIPTEKEIFGENVYGETEPDTVQQFEPMKLRRNRIAFRGYNGDYEWYWLQNRSVTSAPGACLVSLYGYAGHAGASHSLGVRPLFKIGNLARSTGGKTNLWKKEPSHENTI